MSRSTSAVPAHSTRATRSVRALRGGATLAAAALALSGCSAPDLPTPLTVYAAASLDPVLAEIADDFTAEYPEWPVAPITFDGSSTLVTQIGEGAPADVLVTADEASMARLGDAVSTPDHVVAENVMTIAVQPGNPRRIHGLADLVNPDLSVVVCAPEVPCGAVASRLLSDANVTVTAASAEQNVTAVVRKVEIGDADAGLVYRTDVAHAPGVDAIEIAGADSVPNRYPAAVVADTDQPDIAAAFVRFLDSDRARSRFRDAGFLLPE